MGHLETYNRRLAEMVHKIQIARHRENLEKGLTAFYGDSFDGNACKGFVEIEPLADWLMAEKEQSLDLDTCLLALDTMEAYYEVGDILSRRSIKC